MSIPKTCVCGDKAAPETSAGKTEAPAAALAGAYVVGLAFGAVRFESHRHTRDCH